MQTLGQLLEFYQERPRKLSYYKDLDVAALPGNVAFQMRREKQLNAKDHKINVSSLLSC